MDVIGQVGEDTFVVDVSGEIFARDDDIRLVTLWCRDIGPATTWKVMGAFIGPYMDPITDPVGANLALDLVDRYSDAVVRALIV